ncbi:D-alanine--D-alanine ligase [Pontibacillus yanchengensis]|uniref:D-alanine--D-alanine ligase n=2 Tax=Pontibacillus yanchengensis TaxID=462910 RepID=A0ACC7VK20_9BACI|nr:D-alanine--D-alanine ligase [Pontibacillus yanchengensis]MYL55112.1 D-alanine--D-alanine ligase [Pontibacillus yanchengensis]
MKIAVLYGGISGEREVSLSTGKGIIKALEYNGHDVSGIDFHPEQIHEILDLDVDIVFIGLHGKHGEDGRIQGLLDMLGVPYVGSGVLASSLAMDKSKAKQIFHQNGLQTAQSISLPVQSGKNPQTMVEEVKQALTLPLVIKPNQEGSTLGLTIVKTEDQLLPAIKEAIKCDSVILAEEYVVGREVTVAVMGTQGNEKALPVIEIIPKNDYYDYESKYTPGGSEHVCPAEVSKDITTILQRDAVLAHQLLGCNTYSRVDFIISNDGKPIILEVNTLPGMTPTSLFPDAANVMGMSYEQMVEEFVCISLQD